MVAEVEVFFCRVLYQSGVVEASDQRGSLRRKGQLLEVADVLIDWLLQDLPSSVNTSEVLSYFKRFGRVVDLVVKKEKLVFATVEYLSPSDASDAGGFVFTPDIKQVKLSTLRISSGFLFQFVAPAVRSCLAGNATLNGVAHDRTKNTFR